jgi:hypothetical protein
MSHLGHEGVYLLTGAVYVLVPLLAVSFACGKQVKRKPVMHGLLGAGLFFLLTLPAVYLQCGVLPFGVALSWIAGIFLGSVTGAPLGFSLRTYFTLLASDQPM